MGARSASRLLLLLFAALVATLGLAFAPQPAVACSCAPSPSDEAVADRFAADRADVIFVGTLADQDVDAGTGMQTLDFDVSAVYKGEISDHQRVISSGSNGCGYEPVGEGPHLMFVSTARTGDVPARSYLKVIECSPSRAVAVGAAFPTLGIPAVPSQDRASPLPVVLVTVAAVALVLGGVALRRRRAT